MPEQFKPNKLTFAQGLDRIRSAVGKERKDKIVTSRDEFAEKSAKALTVTNVPGGFSKVQLPVYFEGGPGAQFFISVGQPNTPVDEHSHDEGDGIRFIVSGSVHYNGKELTAGDWMFIPKGQKYSLTVGKLGAVMCYCYQCCCA